MAKKIELSLSLEEIKEGIMNLSYSEMREAGQELSSLADEAKTNGEAYAANEYGMMKLIWDWAENC